MTERPANDNDRIDDDLYDQALRLVSTSARASTSHLQRQLRIGYNTASRLLDRMRREGFVVDPD